MPDESGEQPGGQPPPYGEAGANPPSPPPEPPPYGQAGASWPNSQPAPPSEQLPPTHSIPGQPQVPVTAAGLPYGAGQPPPGPPGSHPYGGPGGYGGPYIPPLPKQTSTGKIVALVVGLILLVTCGVAFAVVVAIFSIGKDVAETLDEYEPPQPTVQETVSVAPGEGFLLGDVAVESGWSVEVLQGLPLIQDMRGTAVGVLAYEAVAFDLTFYRGDRVVAEGACGGSVDEADVVEIACTVSDKKARKADRVEVESLI